ncbi:MAG: acetate kinase [Verrucomicrobiales bacterium]|nr:acetate kinase [Verrucomicrobiales bacterium]
MPSAHHPTTILVINCGSSSIKFAVIQPQTGIELVIGQVDRLGETHPTLTWKINTKQQQLTLSRSNHTAALQKIIALIPEDLEIDAIGHRVVHGGEQFTQSVLITDDVLAGIEHCSSLAPLHNPANLAGIHAATTVFADKPQVAVFDTAFHQTLPRRAFMYAIPYEWYSQDRFRRYGFHGTSYAYVATEAAKKLSKPLGELSLIIAHLGNGCSVCAVEAGRSIDTSMGLSPLEGLVMGTRSGDVDPALHAFLATHKGWTLDRIMQALNQESGLLGLSGQSNDMRTLVSAAEQGNDRAQLAIEVFNYRLAKSIMALTTGLSQLDAIVFTGGIGENSSSTRAEVLTYLTLLQPTLDPERNAQHGTQSAGRITSDDSFPCLVIPTNEELMIARETLTLISTSTS